MKDLDSELELPMDEDENVGDGLGKKRSRRKKSKEERVAERRVIFWTFLIIVGATIFFWLWPRLRQSNFLPSLDEYPKKEWKNYVEYKL